MARRHLRIKEEGWRLGLAINGTGASDPILELILTSRAEVAAVSEKITNAFFRRRLC
jgi:hypothetical protein